MRFWGFLSLAGSVVLVGFLVVQWESSGAILGDSWIATGETIVLAILAGSAAICGVVLIAADRLHDRLTRLVWAQQSNPKGIADATASRTPDDS